MRSSVWVTVDSARQKSTASRDRPTAARDALPQGRSRDVPVLFENRWGGLPQMGTRYVNTSGVGLTSYQWSNTGSLVDYRDVSYGAGECKANDGNGPQVYVDRCYVEN